MSNSPPYFTPSRIGPYAGEGLLQDLGSPSLSPRLPKGPNHQLQQELWSRQRKIDELEMFIQEILLPLQSTVEQLLARYETLPDMGLLVKLQAGVIEKLLKEQPKPQSSPNTSHRNFRIEPKFELVDQQTQTLSSKENCFGLQGTESLNQFTSETLKTGLKGSSTQFSPKQQLAIVPFSQVISPKRTEAIESTSRRLSLNQVRHPSNGSGTELTGQGGTESNTFGGKYVFGRTEQMNRALMDPKSSRANSQRAIQLQKHTAETQSIFTSHLTVPPNLQSKPNLFENSPDGQITKVVELEVSPQFRTSVRGSAESSLKNKLPEKESQGSPGPQEPIRCSPEQIASFRAPSVHPSQSATEVIHRSKFADKDKRVSAVDIDIAIPDQASSDEVLSHYLPSVKQLVAQEQQELSKTPLSRASGKGVLGETFHRRAESDVTDYFEKSKWLKDGFPDSPTGEAMAKPLRSSLRNSPAQKLTHPRRLSQLAPAESAQIVLAKDIFKTAENFLKLGLALDNKCKEKSGFSILSNKRESVTKLLNPRHKRTLLIQTQKESELAQEQNTKPKKKSGSKNGVNNKGWLQTQKDSVERDINSSHTLGASHFRRISKGFAESVRKSSFQGFEIKQLTHSKQKLELVRSEIASKPRINFRSTLWPSVFKPATEFELVEDLESRIRVRPFDQLNTAHN